MDTHNPKPSRRRAIAWPVSHMLALAPLDVWIRMLIRSGGVKPRYWPRLAFILVTSLIGTIATVHERVVLSVVWHVKIKKEKRRAGSPSHREISIEHDPGTIVIVGYYRTGTTHLHNLMSCDDRIITPRWHQCLAGQGFVLGWSILRFVLVPFLGSTRPQDAVGFGPNWPAEDDFAMSTWGMCSSIPGRFIWPSQWDDWKRWHALENLSDKELHRWRSLMAMFVWKLTRSKRNRAKIVLLKTPSHTARIAELDRLFGGNVKFVHLVREPTETIDSNVRLHLSLDGHLLEDAPDVQTIRDRVVEEYAHTESKAASELHSLNDDERTNSKRYIRVRYQDLRADEMGTLQEIYNTLGIPNLWWNSECESSARSYLQSLGTYTTNRKLLDLGTPSEREQEVCEEMREYHCHDVPPANESNIDPVEQAPSRIWRGIASGTLIAIACALAWIGIVWAIHAINPNIHARFVPAVWICGALIGMGAHKAAGTGSRRVGLVAAALTILVVLGVAFPVTVINWNWAADGTRSEWIYHNAKGGYEGLRSVASVVFIILGALTAYRHGSSAGPKAPGNESLTL